MKDATGLEDNALVLDLLGWFAARFGSAFSRAAVLGGLSGDPDLTSVDGAEQVFATVGLKCRHYKQRLRRLDPAVLPCVAFREDGHPLIITEIDRRTRRVIWLDPAQNCDPAETTLKKAQAIIRPVLLLVTPDEAQASGTRPVASQPDNTHWFWRPIWENRSAWMQVLLASLLLNTLGLALPLFIMNVYDKVVPNLSFVTLWTLAIGVTVALGFDFLLRMIRSVTLHRIARRVDLKVGASVYRHALDLGLLDRPEGSSGMVGKIREYENIRDFFTSSTFISFFDLIFIGVFLAVLYIIVGPLVLVPLVAVPIVLTLALLARIPISSAAPLAVEQARRRQILLSESLRGIETVKSLSAEPDMRRSWEQILSATARTSGFAQFWSNASTHITAFVQQMTSVGVIIWGVYLIFAGDITVGALIAASLLTSRALAPLSMIAQATFRTQYALNSLRALDETMRVPTEPSRTIRSNLVVHRGDLKIDDLTFAYPDAESPAIDRLTLAIDAKECVALVGRVGSGKTTLGRLITGLLEPGSGTIRVDGFGLQQFARAELRAGLGYLPQRAELFTGTIRENLLLGQKNATQDQIERALYYAGFDRFISGSSQGLNMQIGEGGGRLSGGQAQALSLARLLIRPRKILFLDEPTNAMDQEMERLVCSRLAELNRDGTGLILCTHRLTVASMAERFVVLDQGRLLVDDKREAVLARLRGAQS